MLPNLEGVRTPYMCEFHFFRIDATWWSITCVIGSWVRHAGSRYVNIELEFYLYYYIIRDRESQCQFYFQLELIIIWLKYFIISIYISNMIHIFVFSTWTQAVITLTGLIVFRINRLADRYINISIYQILCTTSTLTFTLCSKVIKRSIIDYTYIYTGCLTIHSL